MKFYNRDQELALLSKIEEISVEFAQMTVVVGRRRVGKTSLLLEAYKKHNCLYFFVAKKNEALLCMEFVEEVKQKLQVPIFGEIKTFKALFGFLMELSKFIPDSKNNFHALAKIHFASCLLDKDFETILLT